MNNITPTAPEPPKPPQYMSYIPYRRPNFKTHEKKNGLTNSISAYISSKVGGKALATMYAYELKGDKYELMWTIVDGDSNEDLPWKKKIHQPYKPPHIQCHCPQCKP